MWNQGKLAAFDELIAPSLVYHDPVAPYVRTFDDYKQHVIDTRNAFPDIRFTIDDIIGDRLKKADDARWVPANLGAKL